MDVLRTLCGLFAPRSNTETKELRMTTEELIHLIAHHTAGSAAALAAMINERRAK